MSKEAWTAHMVRGRHAHHHLRGAEGSGIRIQKLRPYLAASDSAGVAPGERVAGGARIPDEARLADLLGLVEYRDGSGSLQVAGSIHLADLQLEISRMRH